MDPFLPSSESLPSAAFFRLPLAAGCEELAAPVAAAGAAAGGAGTSLYGYNREAWMTDVQVKQSRRLQKQQILLSQVEMFRDDIRDLIGAATTKQGNYIIVVTLILGMMSACYMEGPASDEVPEYLKTVYNLCVGSSLLHFISSLFCILGANWLATSCERDFLTTVVRLPIKDLECELEDAAFEESVEGFEHQGFSTILRLPGFSRVKRKSSVGNVTQTGTTRADMVEGWRQNYMLAYKAVEARWEAMTSDSALHAAAGVGNLLQAFGYFSLMRFYQSSKWSSWVVQALVIFVHALLAGAFCRMYQDSRIAGWIEIIAVVVGPTACMVSVWYEKPEWIDSVCIPACFFMHFVVSLVGFIRLRKSGDIHTSSQMKLSRAPTFQQLDRAQDDDSLNSNETEKSGDGGDASWTTEVSQRAKETIRSGGLRPLASMRYAGSGGTTFLWFFCFLWVVYDLLTPNEHKGMIPASNARRLLGVQQTRLGSELQQELETLSLADFEDKLAGLGLHNGTHMHWVNEADVKALAMNVVQSRQLLEASSVAAATAQSVPQNTKQTWRRLDRLEGADGSSHSGQVDADVHV